MRKFLIIVSLTMLTAMALLCMDIDKKQSFALIVVGLLLCWAVFDWRKDKGSPCEDGDETLLETDEDEDTIPCKFTTRDLCLQQLDKMNLEYKVIYCEKDDYDCYEFHFMGDRILLQVSSEGTSFTLIDMDWRQYPIYVCEKGINERVREAINRVNENSMGFTLYSTTFFKKIQICTSTTHLLIQEIPDIDHYFSDILYRLLKIHETFAGTMTEILEEENVRLEEEKNTVYVDKLGFPLVSEDDFPL